jgi:hypothetical protein
VALADCRFDLARLSAVPRPVITAACTEVRERMGKRQTAMVERMESLYAEMVDLNSQLIALEASAEAQAVIAERSLGESRPRLNLPLGGVHNLLSLSEQGIRDLSQNRPFLADSAERTAGTRARRQLA